MTKTLLERLAEATGPDVRLDAEIAQPVGWTSPKGYLDGGAIMFSRVREHPHAEAREHIAREMLLPRYTDSLDAARSIPPGCLAVFASDIGADGMPMVTLLVSTNPVVEVTGIGRTLALAWCEAALKARAAGSGEG